MPPKKKQAAAKVADIVNEDENKVSTTQETAKVELKRGRGKAPAKPVVEEEKEAEEVEVKPKRGRQAKAAKAENGKNGDAKEEEPEKEAVAVKPKRGKKAAPVVPEPVEEDKDEEMEDDDDESIASNKGSEKSEEAAEIPEAVATEPEKKTGRGGRAKAAAAKKVEEEDEDEEEVEAAPEKEVKKRGRKPAAEKKEKVVVEKKATSKRKGKAEANGDDEVEEKKSKGGKEPLQNPTETNYSKIDFTCNKKNELGEEHNFKIASWNVDGLRAWLKKEALEYISREDPDIICLQETKCSEDKLPEEIKDLNNYKQYWAGSDKSGYAGVAVFSKVEPIEVKYGIGDEKQDEDGRCIMAEFEKFYLVNVYVPNAGRKLITLPKRLEWNEAFKTMVQDLDKKKPVIICGDMNVAHNEIDLANPATNKKNAGFTQEERDGMSDFISAGFVDTFRKFYPDEKDKYTFWTYMMKSRSKNVGWRLDYFLVSERFMESICDNVIRHEVFGSDHCPITLFLTV